MKTPQDIKETLKLFKLFSDETRLRIIALLATGEYCVHEICAQLTMSQSSISHQLKHLRELNVVQFRKEGKHVYYALKDEHMLELYNVAYAHANHCE